MIESVQVWCALTAYSAVQGLIEDTNRDVVQGAHQEVGLNQKGGVKRIQLWGRMLRSFNCYTRYRSRLSNIKRSCACESRNRWRL